MPFRILVKVWLPSLWRLDHVWVGAGGYRCFRVFGVFRGIGIRVAVVDVEALELCYGKDPI
jgi:hypothetical protein